jgi:hypothetical protein
MEKFRKVLRKKAFTIILAVLLLVISAVLYTVSAWTVKTSQSAGAPVELTAAYFKIIGYDKVEDFELGIPGETDPPPIIDETLNVKLLVDEDSNRAFVYCIELAVDSTTGKLEFCGESLIDGDLYGLGTLNMIDGRDTKKVVTIDIANHEVVIGKVIGNKYYGIWIPGDGDIEVKIPINIYYYGEEVVQAASGVFNNTYDGNITMGSIFELTDGELKVKYCQATPQAVRDVFNGAVKLGTVLGNLEIQGGP